MIQRLATVAWLLVLCALPAFGQTSPCDGPSPTAFFVAPAGGVNFVFSYATVDHDGGVDSYKLTLRQAVSNAIRSEQTVPKANATLVGPTATAGIGCYSIPVVPVTSLPRGQPLVATLTATSSASSLSSVEGPETAPFGAPLGPPAVRPRAAP